MLTKVAARDIRIGMFVAELDRPWTDTPFLMQGFLVEDAKQLEQLKELCQFVQVDRTRSVEGVFPEIRDSDTQPRAALSPEPEKRRRSSGQTTRRPSAPKKWSESDLLILDVIQELGPHDGMATGAHIPVDVVTQPGMFESLRERFGGLFRKREGVGMPERRAAGRRQATDGAPSPVRHDFIPATMPLTIHRETKAMEAEMPQARQAFSQVEEISRQLIDDIHAGRLFSVEGLEEVVDDVVASALRSPDALMLVTRLKEQDVAIYGHSLQVAVYLVAFGRHLGLQSQDLARLAMLGLFLDLGKTKVPAALLSRPGPLTPEEFALVKQHVSHGVDLIRQIPDLHRAILEGVAQHHEREDGSGYPAGLRADGISLFGRMAGIVDTFVAMINPRPYETTISAYEALRKISDLGGSLFHAPMVEQFVQTVGAFPVGSRVELSTGEIAIVLRQSTVRRLKPKVLVVAGADKVPLKSPTTLDLLYLPADREGVHIVRGLPAASQARDAAKSAQT